uniref:Transposon protein, putative, CACTA, En/Spm sub-class n=1 Tax=Oryza sativa subsp. japonica TaxID=39947 RepID=Q5W6Q9_ORYSJ|nr:hypothetical protein [Oryza sativa Japonica Group]
MKGYTCWVKHGEQESGSGAAADRSGAHNQEDEDGHDMFIPFPLGGEMVDVDHDLLQDMLRDVEDPAQNERDSMKFSRLVSDSETPLYVGCKAKHTKLSVTLDLMKLKASSGWTDKSFTDLLGILKAMLPGENTLLETTYEAKQVLCPLGLEVRRIYACPNDCILYHKQYADLDACPVCKASRYKRKKSADEGKKSKRGGPAKVVWYLPIIDRFKRIFANPNEAKLVRWHATERRNDGGRPPKRPASAPSAPPAQDRHAQSYDVQLQYDTDFGEDRTEANSKAIHEPPPMKKSRKTHSSPQRITLDKPEAKGRGRGGKVQASLLAPRKLDLGKGQEETKGKEVKKKYVAPQEFQLGMPLVGDDVIAAMGTACKDLHVYYVEKSNARRPNKATDILGEHDGKPFLGPTNYIVVDFKDLFDLYRLRAVDTSLLKCYSLLSWQWCQKNAPKVAFLDPQVVTVTNLQNDRQGMVNYIYDTLWYRRDKEYIMCAYNQYVHWILLVITPKWSTCHYLNSRIDKNAYDWTPIQLAIDEAWA